MSHTYESRTPREGTASGVDVLAAKQNFSPNKLTDGNCKRRHSREASFPYRASTDVASGVVARFPRPCVRERDDAYPSIVRVGDVRVIECRERLQWIWQRRQKSGRWVDLGYFRNRDVLIERSGLDLAELLALPPYHLGRELSTPNRLLIATE